MSPACGSSPAAGLGRPSMANLCPRAPCTGGLDVTAANSTPGSWRTRSSADRQNVTASGKDRPPSELVSSRFSGSMPAGRRLQVQEAADHQPGADKKHERDRQLRDDQQAARPAAAEPAGRARGFQPIAEIDLRRMQRGHETEHDARDQRDEQGDREDAPVHRHRHPLGNVAAGDREGQQRVCRPARQQHAQRAAQQKQQHALDEHLPDEARPAGPERRSDDALPRSRHGARQQQVGDVGARDEQHEADGAEHQQQSLVGLGDPSTRSTCRAAPR